MRVVMFGPRLDVMGGVTSVVNTWLSARAIREVDLTYLATTADGHALLKLRQGVKSQIHLGAHFLRDQPADLYHIHLAADASLWRKLWFFNQVLQTGRPIVLHIHGALVERSYENSPFFAAALRFMLTRAARVFVLYRDFGESVTRWTAGKARPRLLLNPVALDQLARPADLPRPPRPTVLFMGVIGWRKGPFDLLKAIPEIRAAVPDVLVRFGGNGEIDKLRAEATALGVQDSVEVPGWISGADRVAAFHRASAFCLPSYNEVLPMSIIEAMAASLPVVATNIAGIPEEVVDGETGFLVPPGSPVALARRLVDVLAQPARAQAMGAAGLARARALFDHEVVTRRLIDLWQDAVERPEG